MTDTCKKIGSVKQLEAVRTAAVEAAGSSAAETEKILICMGGGCIASGSECVKNALLESLDKHKLGDKVSVVETGCLGPCVRGPVVMVGADRAFYQNLKPDDAEKIVEQHVIGGKIVEELTWTDDSDNSASSPKIPVPLQDDIEFFKRQTKIVLRNCGLIDPGSITEYIARDGYRALGKVLDGMTSDDVLSEMNKSGLKGRGGGGFPTGRKWEFAIKSPDPVKYILCNADEGDPGAFMDRSVLEGDPHSVIEGMAIGGFTIGSSQGYVYVRAEYPLAVERLQKAIQDARAAGLLGENILGTGFSFDLEIRMGSGAFVCGEETALIASIEGERGEPRSRPPFPAVKGLWEKPTLLNNVETYANVPAILLNGGDWFASFGTENSKGTKVFALAGAINISGLVEVPVGTTFREIIYDIGGGILGGKKFKAAQIGGPSGGCIPEQYLDTPIDYESLNALGAIMGSGGLVVMDEDTCMVDVARFFLEFMQEESCGKCVPCRLGITRMLDIINGITQGHGQPGDIEELQQIGEGIQAAALCGLGQTAPNPVLSTIRHFRDEYEAHINDKHCPAHVCKDLVSYSIDAEKCTGCTLCAKKCPTDAITGVVKGPHAIVLDKCIACGMCLEVCRFDAVSVK
ncbi:MAG: NADH-quinone oxidoreductase subunit NuoF [Phycisphaerae bacterium]|nr:NADH-quinone oxidoreductase subunit NuoF [Phycisphaerae bacterium]